MCAPPSTLFLHPVKMFLVFVRSMMSAPSLLLMRVNLEWISQEALNKIGVIASLGSHISNNKGCFCA